MTEFAIRYFDSEEAVARVGEGLLGCNLTRPEWTHEAHLAATCWLLLRHPEVDLDQELPGLIRRLNESFGGVNDDRQGYHDTITRAYLHGVRTFLAASDVDRPVHEIVNALLSSPVGRRDWPLGFWSKERLFSVAARRGWVEPDRSALP